MHASRLERRHVTAAVVSLRPDGMLALEPDPTLQQLRDRHWHFEEIDLADSHDRLLSGVESDSLEIITTFAPDSKAEYGLKLRCSLAGREYTRISVDGEQRQIVLKRDHASLDLEVQHDCCTAPLAAAPGEPVTLHIFLDRSVIELSTDDGRTTLTGRNYPVLADSVGVALFSRGGSAHLQSLDIWTMKSIWEDQGPR